MSDSIPEKTRKGGEYGQRVIVGGKMEEVRSNADQVCVMEVALNRGERFVSAYPFTY